MSYERTFVATILTRYLLLHGEYLPGLASTLPEDRLAAGLVYSAWLNLHLFHRSHDRLLAFWRPRSLLKFEPWLDTLFIGTDPQEVVTYFYHLELARDLCEAVREHRAGWHVT